jgi:O-6-methylguanine DNA methyltransferase
MGAIVESNTVRAELTRYEVPGWGVGELWTAEGLVLAHDFDFGAELSDDAVSARGRNGADSLHGPPPPIGALSPPTGTLLPISSQRGFGSVTSQSRVRATRWTDENSGLDPDVLAGRLTAFFSGEVVAFEDVPLDFSSFTHFQRTVANALRGIPRGEVVAYGELAALAGYPGAQRAVGTFCARNRFMVVVPCHRVVSADGIGSYGSAGRTVKRRLLALEGVVL